MCQVADIGVTPERFRERGERRNAMRYVGAYVAGSAIGDGRLVSAQGDTENFARSIIARINTSSWR